MPRRKNHYYVWKDGGIVEFNSKQELLDAITAGDISENTIVFEGRVAKVQIRREYKITPVLKDLIVEEEN
jgi:hypothetical protein